MNEQDWKQLKYLAAFVSDIDFANVLYKPVQPEMEGTDIYLMDAGDKAFGWAWNYSYDDISKTKLRISEPSGKKYNITWYNTWTGMTIKSESNGSVSGTLMLTVPVITPPVRDIAFKISPK